MTAPALVVDRDIQYRRIDPNVDGQLAYSNYRQTCIASFGHAKRCMDADSYQRWLRQRVDEYPDGHVLAVLKGQLVGQLELQVPYGLHRGYVNLFYITEPWRRLGLGRRMHDFAIAYFRSWEARWVELHVSPTNQAAVGFYRSLGYRLAMVEHDGAKMWRMERSI